MSTGKELADIDLSSDSYWSREGKAAGGGTSDSLGPMPSLPGRGVDPDSGMDRIEQTASAPEMLREHLLIQLGMEISEAFDRLIGSALIDMVDGAGYLSGDLKGVAESFSCPLARIENVLEKLQDFDPPGVGARDLGECLAIQLHDVGRFDPAMAVLIDNLDALAAGDATGLIKLCGVGAEDLTDMVAEIKRLNPKPGLVFENDIVQTVVPDVFVRPAPDGSWDVELNSEALPRVMVDNNYYVELRSLASARS